MKKFVVLFSSILFSGLACAADTVHSKADSAGVEHYAYGMNLDIDHVVSMPSDTAADCGVHVRNMVYEDSAGQQHVLQYEAMNSSQLCSGG